MKWFNRFYLLYIIFLIILLFTSCNNIKYIPVKEYVYITDTISEKKYLKEIEVLKYDISLIKDSSNIIIDSLNNVINELNSDNFVLNYKLLRIKEYNRIAAQGNNIKFLRGWINRVLNE